MQRMPQSGSGARSAVRLMPAARALEAGGEHALACQRLRALALRALQPPGELQWGGLHVADDDERSIVRTSYFQRLAFTYILAGTSKNFAGTSSSYRACHEFVSLAKTAPSRAAHGTCPRVSKRAAVAKGSRQATTWALGASAQWPPKLRVYQPCFHAYASLEIELF